MVKLFLQPVYKGAKTQTVIEKFRPILKKSLHDYLNEIINEKLQSAINSTNTAGRLEEGAITSEEEWNAFSLIKNLLKDTLDTNKITYKCTESYTAILYDNNSRKWICLRILKGTQKTLILPDENKKEVRCPVYDIDDISDYTDQLIEVCNRYLYPAAPSPKELLHTRWGIYEMPSPYTVDLTKGPRNHLKCIQP